MVEEKNTTSSEEVEKKEEKPKSFYEPKYICLNCGYVVSWRELQIKVLCPKCGKNIFFKLRPEDRVRHVKAR